MGTILVFIILCCGVYQLKKALPKLASFAANNPNMVQGGGVILKKLFGR